MIGPDKAASASLIPFVSENALPHKMSDDRSISAATNPLFPLDPRPILSPTPGLHGQKSKLEKQNWVSVFDKLTTIIVKKSTKAEGSKTQIG